MEKYHCVSCNKVVIPIRLWRANYQCPKCKSDITLEVVLQYEARQESLKLNQPDGETK